MLKNRYLYVNVFAAVYLRQRKRELILHVGLITHFHVRIINIFLDLLPLTHM